MIYIQGLLGSFDAPIDENIFSDWIPFLYYVTYTITFIGLLFSEPAILFEFITWIIMSCLYLFLGLNDTVLYIWIGLWHMQCGFDCSFCKNTTLKWKWPQQIEIILLIYRYVSLDKLFLHPLLKIQNIDKYINVFRS